MTKRTVDAADAARHVLLGLLLDGASYGYMLARAFAEGTALGTVVYLGSSHLYTLLAQLEREGLVSGAREEQGARPPRRVYTITDAGRASVQRWVEEPVARPRDVLLDFPLKLYLAMRIDPDRAKVLVAQQREQFAAYLADLERPSPADASPDRAFIELVREGRVARTRATLAWLDRCAALRPGSSNGSTRA